MRKSPSKVSTSLKSAFLMPKNSKNSPMMTKLTHSVIFKDVSSFFFPKDYQDATHELPWIS